MNELINIQIPATVTKQSIKQLANNVIDNAMDEGRVLHTAEGLAVMEKLVKAVREEQRFVDAVCAEVGKQLTTSNGTVLEVVESAVKYDYSHDAEWKMLQEEIDILTARRKEREAILKTAKEGQEKVIEDTGELITGANKKSKTTYKITLAK